MDKYIQEFKNIPFEKRTNCVVCGQRLGPPLISLPKFPVTGVFTKELVKEKLGFVDQYFYLCSNCCHGEISNVLSLEVQYGSSYYFRTSTSATATKASEVFASFIINAIGEKEFRNIVDIGCNDLYLLNSLQLKSEKLIGIDPVLAGREKEFSKGKLKVIGEFFEKIDLKAENLHFDSDLILTSFSLEHMSDPKAFTKMLLDNATDKTLFAFQFPGLELLLNDCRFDQIFHQHLNYFSLKSLVILLDELGAELIKYDINYGHWGTFMILFRKKSGKSNDLNKRFLSAATNLSAEYVLKQYEKFQKNMNLLGAKLDSLKGELMYGYGAAMMLPTLSYHLKNDLSCLKYVLDDDESKNGLHYINLPVEIKYVKNVKDIKDSIILITAIDNSRQILSRLVQLNPRRIILPIANI